MNGETSPASKSIQPYSFYESRPKRSRLHETDSLRPSFKTLNDRLVNFDKELSEPIKSSLSKEPEQQQDAGEEQKNLDRDSPIPLKNLGNTCYENSIIQCLFSLNMFMDRFERSMKIMRQLVKPTKSKLPDSDPLAIAEGLRNEDTRGVAEDDVRYRIANAFDNLYQSYTKRRNQLESDNRHSSKTTTKQEQNPHSNKSPLRNAHASEAAFELGKSQDENSHPMRIKSRESERCDVDPEFSSLTNTSEHPSSTPATEATTTTVTNTLASTFTTTDTTASNLTPIALVSSVSSAPSEQTEIETRLEELKLAVGERSSQFNSAHQQDASEFFYHVIDSVQEFYQSLHKTKDDDNPVTKVFELELDYLIKCPKCHHRTMSETEKVRTLPLALPHVNSETTSNADEFNPEANGIPTPPTSDLGLDSPKSSDSEDQKNSLSDEKENQAATENVVSSEPNSNNTMSIAKLELSDKQENNPPSQAKRYTLCDALHNYFKDDLLEYKCSQPGCDSKQRTKKCLIRKLPQVLFITLARYSYTGKKSLEEIEAPFELSVPFQENKSPSHSPSAHRDFNDGDDMYQLVAVVCHLGSSLNAGHYTSYVYNQNNFSWYSCDDDSITKVQEADVKTDASKSGYCFFYAHKSCVAYDVERNANQVSSTNDNKSLAFLRKSGALVVSSSVADSSVVMTPEPSPQSSPARSTSSDRENSSPMHITSGIDPDSYHHWPNDDSMV